MSFYPWGSSLPNPAAVAQARAPGKQTGDRSLSGVLVGEGEAPTASGLRAAGRMPSSWSPLADDGTMQTSAEGSPFSSACHVYGSTSGHVNFSGETDAASPSADVSPGCPPPPGARVCPWTSRSASAYLSRAGSLRDVARCGSCGDAAASFPQAGLASPRPNGDGAAPENAPREDDLPLQPAAAVPEAAQARLPETCADSSVPRQVPAAADHESDSRENQALPHTAPGSGHTTGEEDEPQRSKLSKWADAHHLRPVPLCTISGVSEIAIMKKGLLAISLVDGIGGRALAARASLTTRQWEESDPSPEARRQIAELETFHDAVRGRKLMRELMMGDISLHQLLPNDVSTVQTDVGFLSLRQLLMFRINNCYAFDPSSRYHSAHASLLHSVDCRLAAFLGEWLLGHTVFDLFTPHTSRSGSRCLSATTASSAPSPGRLEKPSAKEAAAPAAAAGVARASSLRAPDAVLSPRAAVVAARQRGVRHSLPAAFASEAAARAGVRDGFVKDLVTQFTRRATVRSSDSEESASPSPRDGEEAKNRLSRARLLAAHTSSVAEDSPRISDDGEGAAGRRAPRNSVGSTDAAGVARGRLARAQPESSFEALSDGSRRQSEGGRESTTDGEELGNVPPSASRPPAGSSLHTQLEDRGAKATDVQKKTHRGDEAAEALATRMINEILVSRGELGDYLPSSYAMPRELHAASLSQKRELGRQLVLQLGLLLAAKEKRPYLFGLLTDLDAFVASRTGREGPSLRISGASPKTQRNAASARNGEAHSRDALAPRKASDWEGVARLGGLSGASAAEPKEASAAPAEAACPPEGGACFERIKAGKLDGIWIRLLVTSSIAAECNLNGASHPRRGGSPLASVTGGPSSRPSSLTQDARAWLGRSRVASASGAPTGGPEREEKKCYTKPTRASAAAADAEVAAAASRRAAEARRLEHEAETNVRGDWCECFLFLRPRVAEPVVVDASPVESAEDRALAGGASHEPQASPSRAAEGLAAAEAAAQEAGGAYEVIVSDDRPAGAEIYWGMSDTDLLCRATGKQSCQWQVACIPESVDLQQSVGGDVRAKDLVSELRERIRRRSDRLNSVRGAGGIATNETEFLVDP
ncbi:hypothetical protein BESB_085360 [Besnoitia besnoiti]|uniref:Uncharacterized protein n=1 Tax=Besnoitia besnoiti TaxID=94643 RepID=A0A2A9MCL6_BESBE|nr:hypothetical protein BESB_085360 [Besnoitia besnoiti]PFH33337.1 hypothetical protein BESB_085360 [Besnoitia besnoiti]